MEMSIDFWFNQLLNNFDLAMLMMAVFFIVLHLIVRFRRVSLYEIFYRWIALFAVGFSGIYEFIAHAFYPVMTAASIGWPTSPFQFNVAVAQLALGLLGVISFRASYGFRLATAIAAVVMRWGDVLGQMSQMAIVNNNIEPSHASTWMWLDIMVPLILVICVIKLKR